MLESHTKQEDNSSKTSQEKMKKKKGKKEKVQLRGDKTEVPPWDGQQ